MRRVIEKKCNKATFIGRSPGAENIVSGTYCLMHRTQMSSFKSDSIENEKMKNEFDSNHEKEKKHKNNAIQSLFIVILKNCFSSK